jgi:hypothetical protein
MKFINIIIILAGFSLSGNLFAMSGLDFIKIENSTLVRNEIEPIVIQFVSDGFRNVPDWGQLSYDIRKLILKNGYGDQSLDIIAKEAALKSGMTK